MTHFYPPPGIHLSRHDDKQYHCRHDALVAFCRSYWRSRLSPEDNLRRLHDSGRISLVTLIGDCEALALPLSELYRAADEADCGTSILFADKNVKLELIYYPENIVYAEGWWFVLSERDSSRPYVLAQGDPEGFVAAAQRLGCLDKILDILHHRAGKFENPNDEKAIYWILEKTP